MDIAWTPPRVSGHISDRPSVSPLVRLQAEEGATVTNQRCEPVRLTDLARHVVGLLDGVHSRDDVSTSVAREIQSGRMAGDWIGGLQDRPMNAERLTDDVLRDLRDRALLVA